METLPTPRFTQSYALSIHDHHPRPTPPTRPPRDLPRSPATSLDLTRPHSISDHHLPQSPANLRAISLSRTFNYHPTSPIVIPKTSVTSVTKLTDDTSLPQHHHTAHHHHIHPFFRIIITNPNVYTTSPPTPLFHVLRHTLVQVFAHLNFHSPAVKVNA